VRILLVHRYFWPDSPPYASILNEMAKMLVSQDMHVDVLSSMPSYKSISSGKGLSFRQASGEGFTVFRLPVLKDVGNRLFKLINFIIFPLQVLLFLLVKRNYDVVTVSSSPPVLLAFFVALASKISNFSLIYHCMDLHPEIGRISGDFRNKLLYKLLWKMELFSCHVAKNIIVLSGDMKTSMAARDPALLGKTVVINNFSLPSRETEHQAPARMLEKKAEKRLVFAGNLGRFQGLDAIVEAVKSFGHTDRLELLFVGEGAYLPALERLAEGSKNIHFLPHQSVSVAKRIVEDADFGIVSLAAGVIKYAFPSKTMTYLECGTPILLCIDDDCEFVKFIEDKGLGYYTTLTDKSEMHSVFHRIVTDDGSILDRESLIAFYERYYSPQIFEEKLKKLIGSVHVQS